MAQKNKEMMKFILLFGIIALFSILPMVSASNWVEFGYDLNNSNWDKITYPFGVNESNFTDIGGFYAVAVVNGNVYFVSIASDKLYRANASDISQVYETFQTGGDIYNALAVVDGIVYLGSGDGYIYMLNANNVSEMINSYNVGSAISYGIVVQDDSVYFSATSVMYQVNKSNVSQVLNTYSTGQTIASNPTVKNGYVYIADIITVSQLNASDLSLVHNFAIGSYIFGSVAVTEDYVFIGKNGIIVQLNASDISQEISRLEGFGDMNVKPTIANGYVYFASIDDLYQCNYNNISQVVNMFSTPESNSIGYNSPSLRGDKIYLTTSDGHIYTLNSSNISEIISDVYMSGIIFGKMSVTDKYLYVSSEGANANNKMFMFATGEPIVIQEPEPEPEPTPETGFSTSGQAIYDIMNSSGAGLGIFMMFMGQALPILLILLAFVVIVFVIGYAISNVIKGGW